MDGSFPLTQSAVKGPELENTGTTSRDPDSVGLEHGLVISV